MVQSEGREAGCRRVDSCRRNVQADRSAGRKGLGVVYRGAVAERRRAIGGLGARVSSVLVRLKAWRRSKTTACNALFLCTRFGHRPPAERARETFLEESPEERPRPKERLIEQVGAVVVVTFLTRALA